MVPNFVGDVELEHFSKGVLRTFVASMYCRTIVVHSNEWSWAQVVV